MDNSTKQQHRLDASVAPDQIYRTSAQNSKTSLSQPTQIDVEERAKAYYQNMVRTYHSPVPWELLHRETRLIYRDRVLVEQYLKGTND